MRIAAQYIFTNQAEPIKNGFIELKADTIIDVGQFDSGIQESYEMVFFNGVIIPRINQTQITRTETLHPAMTLSADDLLNQFSSEHQFEKNPTVLFETDNMLSQLKLLNQHFKKHRFEEILRWLTSASISINTKPDFVGIDAFNFETMKPTSNSHLIEFKY